MSDEEQYEIYTEYADEEFRYLKAKAKRRERYRKSSSAGLAGYDK